MTILWCILSYAAGVASVLLFVSWRWNRMVGGKSAWPTDERP